MKKLKIEYLPIFELKPYARNAKLHPAEQIEQIKKSIQRVGFRDPIGIWNGEIVEGHGRYIAAQEMGIEEVPVIRMDDMTDEERRAYGLIHNKLTMNSGYDYDTLSMELDDIANIDMSDFGFDFGEDQETPDRELNWQPAESVEVQVRCESESEAEELYNELTERGYKCRTSTL